jgi:hypothetical protein
MSMLPPRGNRENYDGGGASVNLGLIFLKQYHVIGFCFKQGLCNEI